MTSLCISLSVSSASSARALLGQVIDYARKNGVDQRTLATRARISPESLSRLKKAGSCRLTTALELARAAGLNELHLGEAPAGRVAAAIAASKLSAGRRLSISAEDLVSALASNEPSRDHKAHLYGFFEELPIETVHEVILDEDLDYTHLVWLANSLGAEGDTVDWLAEMVGDGLADAA